MSVLYLVEQGATLRKTGDVLVVEKEKEELQRVPAIKVQQVVIFGNVSITTPAIGYLLENGIDTVFLSSKGRYHGRLVSPESKFGELRQLQLAAAANPALKLEVARAIVTGKLRNHRTLLLRFERKVGSPDLNRAAEALGVCIDDAARADNLDTLRGAEGRGAASYFGAFKHVLRNDMGFHTRVRRPPTDPVNSILSFGYTLLAYGMQSAIHTVGLDPYIGFLHSTEYARPSLALDLMEEFRCIIVDSVALRLINTGQLTMADFEQPPDVAPAILIREEGKKRFLAAYEERLQTATIHPASGTQATYRRCLELQVRLLSRVIRGEAPAYVPMTVR